MDQIKIGKFIAECRKKNNLTQMQLAEKLNITDRAISKWENGKAMPDSSIMLDLCKELQISVNELLSGEAIKMENYNVKAEEILLEMAKKEEKNNKRMLVAMYVLMIVSVISLVTIIMLAQQFIDNENLEIAVCAGATIFYLFVMFFGLKLEVDAGYYECKNCHHKFVPTYKEVFLSAHMGTTRHLKCPKCHKKSWAKKVMSK